MDDVKQDLVFAKQQAVALGSNGLKLSETQKAEIRQYADKRFRGPAGGIPILGCIKNVFLYRSFENYIFFGYYLPWLLELLIAPWIMFVGGVICSGWLCRKADIFDTFIFYTLCLVMFSTATTNQYLAIPCVFTCVNYLPFGLLYNIVPGIWFMIWPVSTFGIYIFCIGLLLLMYVQFIVQRKKDI